MEVDAVMETRTFEASVFNLYQEGLAPDQVLQLCFLRRRASRRLRLERTRIEDEFVLPQPELNISNLLPLANIPLEQLIAKNPPAVQTCDSAEAAALTAITIEDVRESARWHFLQPRQAAVEDVRRWSALSESDWLQIHRSMQRSKKQQQDQDDEMTGRNTIANWPDIADICWMLEQCLSDAFVGFVWDHLLLSLLQQSMSANTSMHQLLFSLLVTHHSLGSLSPKDFRAKVRARNLRQVDDAFGAQAELTLIAIYRRQRDAAK
ncbi:hypothetical protein F441_08843 [Phytophthora nicotianae CJ01A1]|uniref:Uncharacterized protein n=5 Tax=Phytophthora nicotianae TaxID=4792 RepID=V9F6S2_PHYNI|nr:hypothetical protein F443_08863 [Phytophthora nicotianae P1569]ETM46538.1 hypothetical protein L914_08578 [Phytophthora nicotianae]ETO75500.1 hypothetical protein F444_08931 [Phytophthora nicotianae P1976]ETP16540.1 hypothetical protein F441_08843 [Phytophthora nicotianae CJ01A1]KUG00238.1 hypothetical protein AM587_10009733 [Phytophthora nicotianae]